MTRILNSQDLVDVDSLETVLREVYVEKNIVLYSILYDGFCICGMWKKGNK